MEIKTIFLILFIVVSVLHLVSLFAKQGGLFKAITKSLLMPLLFGVYFFGVQNMFWPIALAIIFGWAGDVFLLKIESLVRFRCGLASFLLGHLAYILALISFAQPFNTNALAVSFAVAVAFGITMYKFVHPNREMKIPVIIYETVITAMAVLAFQVFLNKGSPLGAFVFGGSILFLVSDSILARFTFGKKPKYGDFWVMATYIPAQLCIVLGFCGL
ncbi:MAG: lysoplasmalogenase [Treponema sp.]|jgi:uncharacterized membrane protein YhhN|nr:lysoplasmalogenase [Treponema sp.]